MEFAQLTSKAYRNLRTQISFLKSRSGNTTSIAINWIINSQTRMMFCSQVYKLNTKFRHKATEVFM
ncbi:CLUMA_CG010263, isoform A [Clunio marinus]|uniref:CLUMA_CG010263, isoform A n=1 Tax=Clunio marinus TaxID=568069 RepID=A0A1J1I936_9DIPT|nr:CLUMA_CG010263, isoform A [Clunio marinus]